MNTSFSSLTLCKRQESFLGTQKVVENFGESLVEKITKLVPAKGRPAPAGLEDVKTTSWVRIGHPASLLLQPWLSHWLLSGGGKHLPFSVEMFVGLLLAMGSWLNSTIQSDFQSS